MNLLSRSEVLTLFAEQGPMLVLSDNLESAVSYGIKRHTSGRYNHAMWLHRQWVFATQGGRFEEVPITDFLAGKHRLRFWHNPAWTREQKGAILADVERKLAQRGRYDWLGVVGQFLKMRWINFSGRDYCSESAGETLSVAEPTFAMRHPSPADLNRWCKDHPQMVTAGIYDPDLNSAKWRRLP